MDGINQKKNDEKSKKNKQTRVNNNINYQITTLNNKNKNDPQTINKFTYNNLNMIRYTPMLILIILLQKSPRAMLSLICLLQLLTLTALVWFWMQGEFESGWISAIFISFEAVFLMFITALFVTTVADRDPGSDDGFWFGTIPLITLMLLMVLLKLIHVFITIALEYKNSDTKVQDRTQRAGGSIIRPVQSKNDKTESAGGSEKDDEF